MSGNAAGARRAGGARSTARTAPPPPRRGRAARTAAPASSSARSGAPVSMARTMAARRAAAAVVAASSAPGQAERAARGGEPLEVSLGAGRHQQHHLARAAASCASARRVGQIEGDDRCRPPARRRSPRGASRSSSPTARGDRVVAAAVRGPDHERRRDPAARPDRRGRRRGGSTATLTVRTGPDRRAGVQPRRRPGSARGGRSAPPAPPPARARDVTTIRCASLQVLHQRAHRLFVLPRFRPGQQHRREPRPRERGAPLEREGGLGRA